MARSFRDSPKTRFSPTSPIYRHNYVNGRCISNSFIGNCLIFASLSFRKECISSDGIRETGQAVEMCRVTSWCHERFSCSTTFFTVMSKGCSSSDTNKATCLLSCHWLEMQLNSEVQEKSVLYLVFEYFHPKTQRSDLNSPPPPPSIISPVSFCNRMFYNSSIRRQMPRRRCQLQLRLIIVIPDDYACVWINRLLLLQFK